MGLSLSQAFREQPFSPRTQSPHTHTPCHGLHHQQTLKKDKRGACDGTPHPTPCKVTSDNGEDQQAL